MIPTISEELLSQLRQLTEGHGPGEPLTATLKGVAQELNEAQGGWLDTEPPSFRTLNRLIDREEFLRREEMRERLLRESEIHNEAVSLRTHARSRDNHMKLWLAVTIILALVMAITTQWYMIVAVLFALGLLCHFALDRLLLTNRANKLTKQLVHERADLEAELSSGNGIFARG